MADRFPSPRSNRPVLPAVAGVAAVALGAGTGELAAALVAPAGSPFAVVGAALIDLAPGWAKELMIALFGTNDKLALFVLMGIALVAAAAAAGLLEARWSPWGRVAIGLGGAIGVTAAATRASAGLADPLPSVLAAGTAIVVLPLLLRLHDRPADPARRRFLGFAGGAAALGALAALGGYALQAGSRAATALRESIALPNPASAAPAVPPTAEFDIPGLAPYLTPNATFYRIDTALRVPQLNPAEWTLRVTGMVDEPFELTWDELLALPLEESVTTLACVSNEVGGDLIGNARWLGYPVRELLARARPRPTADMVLSRSHDGWTAGTPLEVLQDEERDAVLAIGMNGEPLPLEHGFPARLVVPGLYGYVSATKWVVELELTRFDEQTAYWTDRGWAPQGPVKLSSRIDVPAPRATVEAGAVTIAGVAWHQHVGVAAVEVQVDDGPWLPAELASAVSADTWVQWRLRWDASAGDHLVRVRATGSDGEVQTSARAPVLPDGATGLHEIAVTVR